ncbi:MAG: HAD hydrolase-like protein [Alphaproteobacteria bacterium]|nr:HAD hydrolase-like protein [Alphaproteobacteria bacterium]
MSQKLKYISRIKDEFDTIICGVNGVFAYGDNILTPAVDALIKLYQSGKKITLASNSGMRVRDLYYALKQKDVPMNIFYAMITAGEIAHFYLKNHRQGEIYFNLSGNEANVVRGLDYKPADSIVMADFVLAETDSGGLSVAEVSPLLEQALHLHLPLLCVGNNTAVAGNNGIIESVGAVAEQYALMGGQVIPFGKPDQRIAAYLTENVAGFRKDKCLVIGDNMATDMRMGNSFGVRTLLLTGGVHQLGENAELKLNDLSESYGLNVDYYMECLQW